MGPDGEHKLLGDDTGGECSSGRPPEVGGLL